MAADARERRRGICAVKTRRLNMKALTLFNNAWSYDLSPKEPNEPEVMAFESVSERTLAADSAVRIVS